MDRCGRDISQRAVRCPKDLRSIAALTIASTMWLGPPGRETSATPGAERVDVEVTTMSRTGRKTTKLANMNPATPHGRLSFGHREYNVL